MKEQPPSWNPWPWGIGLFVTAFAASMVGFVFWSLHHKQDLVSADYYEQELHYQDTIDHIDRARALGTETIRYDESERAIIIAPMGGNVSAHLALYRPSDASLDQIHELELGPETHAYSTSDLAPGLWKAQLEWKRDGSGYRADLTFIVR